MVAPLDHRSPYGAVIRERGSCVASAKYLRQASDSYIVRMVRDMLAISDVNGIVVIAEEVTLPPDEAGKGSHDVREMLTRRGLI